VTNSASEQSFYDRVAARAIIETRHPLALFAVCSLCGKRTDSLRLHRMDPAPRHNRGCPLEIRPVETTGHQLPPHDYTHPDWQGNGVTKFWTEASLRAYAASSPVEPSPLRTADDIAATAAEVAPLPSIGDECPVCAYGRIGQSQGNFRCGNCGWLGPTIPSPEKASGEHASNELDAARYRIVRVSKLTGDVLAHELDAACDALIAGRSVVKASEPPDNASLKCIRQSNDPYADYFPVWIHQDTLLGQLKDVWKGNARTVSPVVLKALASLQLIEPSQQYVWAVTDLGRQIVGTVPEGRAPVCLCYNGPTNRNPGCPIHGSSENGEQKHG
jgi:hypothetical protein